MSTLLIPGFDTLNLYQGGGFADGGFQIALVSLLGWPQSACAVDLYFPETTGRKQMLELAG